MNEFHQHLDVCRQCADHPFELCARGAVLLQKEAEKPIVLPKDLTILMGPAGGKK